MCTSAGEGIGSIAWLQLRARGGGHDIITSSGKGNAHDICSLRSLGCSCRYQVRPLIRCYGPSHLFVPCESFVTHQVHIDGRSHNAGRAGSVIAELQSCGRRLPSFTPPCGASLIKALDGTSSMSQMKFVNRRPSADVLLMAYAHLV